MRFALKDGAKRNSPSIACAECLVSTKVDSPGGVGCAAAAKRDDMAQLAHIVATFALSNGTHGSPRENRNRAITGSRSVVAGSPG